MTSYINQELFSLFIDLERDLMPIDDIKLSAHISQIINKTFKEITDLHDIEWAEISAFQVETQDFPYRGFLPNTAKILTT